MKNKKYLTAFAAMGLLSSLAIAAPAFAQTANSNAAGKGGAGKAHWDMAGGFRNHGVFGTVTSVNGTTITVTAKNGPDGAAGAVYTVDASNAKVVKAGSASSVSAIAVGDTVMVNGTVSGTNVTATAIRDGITVRARTMEEMNETSTDEAPVIQGNGQPVIGGSVTAINGSTLTVTNKGNVTYSVDASNAKIVKGKATSTISSVAVGDNVVVQGTVNGTSVAASSVIDQSPAANANAQNGTTPAPAHRSFFGIIGGFFAHLFGF